MLALNRESIWREHRPDLILAAAVAVFALYFAFFVRPWSPGYCSAMTLQVFFWGSILSAWAIAVLRLVVGVTFHRLTVITSVLLMVAIFVVNMALLASERMG